ncbi:MAG: hypothetical protein IJX76_00525 [Clostridia bacterium]|nr:hypothetical protein [Clostridia bacterium]
MDRYEKLYAAVDKVFAGTPNTPAALAAKTEIIENLTAKYDDLLADGLSEADAVRITVDSIGDIDELFGEAQKIVPGATPAPFPTEPVPESENERTVKYPAEQVRKGKTVQRLLIAAAVALYILSPVGPILTVAGVPVMIAVSLLFVACGLATAMIVASGFSLPWNNAKGKLLLGLGVGGCVWGLIPMLLLANISEGLAVSAMFATWAISVVLIILSASFKGTQPPAEIEEQTSVRHSEVPEEMMGIYKPIRIVVLLVTLGVYLGISFWTGGWVYTWLIWPMDSCVNRIIRACFWIGHNNREEDVQ